MSGANFQVRRPVTDQEVSSRKSYQALFDSIPQSGLKSDILFLAVKNRIPEEREYVQRLRVVFRFNITKKNELAAVWTCDTRTSIEGDVYRNQPKLGLKVDCTITVDDDDLIEIMVGKLNPQRAFMMSKLKIKGNIILLQKLYAIWFELRRKGRTPELDLIQKVMLEESLIPGLKSEVMAIEIVQRIVKTPYISERVDATIQVNVLRRGLLMVRYFLEIHPGKKPQFRRLCTGSTTENITLPDHRDSTKIDHPIGRSDVVFTIEDDDLVLVIYGIYKVRTMIDQGRLRIEGDSEMVERAIILFEQPPIMARL